MDHVVDIERAGVGNGRALSTGEGEECRGRKNFGSHCESRVSQRPQKEDARWLIVDRGLVNFGLVKTGRGRLLVTNAEGWWYGTASKGVKLFRAQPVQ